MIDNVDLQHGGPDGLRPRLGATDIAGRVGGDPPTVEQQQVIEFEGQTPALVVAGAGSGKTATMASRVVWLVANGLVEPAQVLGLTFTRKAAKELRRRIGKALRMMRANGVGPSFDPDIDVPTVTTYNSFANTIFRDNAPRIGREPDAQLLTEAAAWQLARQVAVESEDERLVELDKSADEVARTILRLSRAMTDNQVAVDQVERFREEFTALLELPYSEQRPVSAKPYARLASDVRQIGFLDVLIPLYQEYERRKRSRSLVEYSDQVAYALQAVTLSDRVRDEYRGRYGAVLLDEYQDTSVSQTKLLSSLFAGTRVMAVGDPHQSIYGWRGASAANLAQFATHFQANRSDVFSLSISWRNDSSILEAANTVAAPLVEQSAIAVPTLTARPSSGEGEITARYATTVEDEAEQVALWLAEQLASSQHTPAKSAALLFRKRSQMPVFAAALRANDIPCVIVGLGGVLESPEVTDIVCALRVISDPSSGSELIRLLAGARWRIGVADLEQLRRLAGTLLMRRPDHTHLTPTDQQRIRASVSSEDVASIVDALDAVGDLPPGHFDLAGFTDAGAERLRQAGKFFARLRRRSGVDLVDLVRLVSQELMLDVELLAHPLNPSPYSNIDAFMEKVQQYRDTALSSTLDGLLGWLDEVATRENVEAEQIEPEPGTVQILTVHAAKGLEWDIVAIPRMVEGETPSKPTELDGWLRTGHLPYELRGDGDDLPQLPWRACQTQKEYTDERKVFRELQEVHQLAEERRIAYVALTRARSQLLLTASPFKSSAVKPAPLSRFMIELVERGIVSEQPPEWPSEPEDHPHQQQPFSWPRDPLGQRRPRVEAAAELVEAARAAPARDAGRWQESIDLLLAERAQLQHREHTVVIPTRIAASRVKDFVTSPAVLAAELRRPMPQKPYRATRLGTLFHSWVEQRYGLTGFGESVDAELFELDQQVSPTESRIASEADAVKLRQLQEIFERSEWAGKKPVAVEEEVHLTLGNQVFICKIDAVFATDDGYQVVDWKTGRAPQDDEEKYQRSLQLSLYRLAYAETKGIQVDQIESVLYYVSDDHTIRIEQPLSRDQMLALWQEKVFG